MSDLIDYFTNCSIDELILGLFLGVMFITVLVKTVMLILWGD